LDSSSFPAGHGVPVGLKPDPSRPRFSYFLRFLDYFVTADHCWPTKWCHRPRQFKKSSEAAPPFYPFAPPRFSSSFQLIQPGGCSLCPPPFNHMLKSKGHLSLIFLFWPPFFPKSLGAPPMPPGTGAFFSLCLRLDYGRTGSRFFFLFRDPFPRFPFHRGINLTAATHLSSKYWRLTVGHPFIPKSGQCFFRPFLWFQSSSPFRVPSDSRTVRVTQESSFETPTGPGTFCHFPLSSFFPLFFFFFLHPGFVRRFVGTS